MKLASQCEGSAPRSTLPSASRLSKHSPSAMRSSHSRDASRSWEATYMTPTQVGRKSRKAMQRSTAYPRGKPKHPTVIGGQECTQRILSGRKGLVTKLLPTGGKRTTQSTASSSQLARSDGSRGEVLFPTAKMGILSEWLASTSTSPSASGQNLHWQSATCSSHWPERQPL